jgi:hypothetical protein
VSRPVSRRPVAMGDAVGTAAAVPTALRRLLVLTPSAGYEESSGIQTAKTRIREEGARPIGIPLVSATAVDLMGRAMEPPRARTWPIVLSHPHPPRHDPRRSTALPSAARSRSFML